MAERTIWFPAKTLGWGWGLPIKWQGWVVLVGYLVLLSLGTIVLDPRFHMIGFLVYTALLSAALIAVCWLKGERPRWRRG
jgi:hypothetical protein